MPFMKWPHSLGKVSEMIEKVCSTCGKPFFPYKRQKYCSEKCRPSKYISSYSKKIKPKKEIESLSETARKAKEAGMTYGKYVSMMERNKND